VLYNYILLIGSINDDLTMLSTAFFILGFAGLEFCIGMLLVIIFKKILKLESFDDTVMKENNIYNITIGKTNRVNQIEYSAIQL
jgi:hypothetical protein